MDYDNGAGDIELVEPPGDNLVDAPEIIGALDLQFERRLHQHRGRGCEARRSEHGERVTAVRGVAGRQVVQGLRRLLEGEAAPVVQLDAPV